MPADEPVDAIGFSLGAITLLRLAMQHPGRFRHLVVAGVGRDLFEPDPDAAARIVAAVNGSASTGRHRAQLFAQYANQPGNDPVALAAIMSRPSRAPLALQRWRPSPAPPWSSSATRTLPARATPWPPPFRTRP